ncbi:MAG: hypothetical protein V3W17_01135 [Desulfobacteria bacterium]
MTRKERGRRSGAPFVVSLYLVVTLEASCSDARDYWTGWHEQTVCPGRVPPWLCADGARTAQPDLALPISIRCPGRKSKKIEFPAVFRHVRFVQDVIMAGGADQGNRCNVSVIIRVIDVLDFDR